MEIRVALVMVESWMVFSEGVTELLCLVPIFGLIGIRGRIAEIIS